VERRTGNNSFTGTAFRVAPTYFHLWGRVELWWHRHFNTALVKS